MLVLCAASEDVVEKLSVRYDVLSGVEALIQVYSEVLDVPSKDINLPII